MIAELTCRLMQQPWFGVLLVLGGAFAAKSSQGAWAAGQMVSSLSIYAGLLATLVATHVLATLVAFMQRSENATLLVSNKSDSRGNHP